MPDKILIQNGRILDPQNGIDKENELFIKNGKISVPFDNTTDTTVINAKGCWVLPGVIDLAVHLREPGYEYKATIASEVAAAKAGGITTFCGLPDTRPPIVYPSDVQLVQQRAKEASFGNVLVVGAMTDRLQGEALAEMAALKKAGCIAVSNVLAPWFDMRIMKRALEYAAGLDLLVMLYPNDHALVQEGCMHQGIVSAHLGLAGISVSAETSALAQCLAIIEDVGTRVHFCRLSSKRSVEMLAKAQRSGLAVSADVAAHQLWLCDEHVSSFNPNLNVLPPLRSKEDKMALVEAVADGTIAAICSDHQPHDTNAKLAPFPLAEPGISGLETLLPLVLALVESETIPLQTAVATMSCQPAKILRIERGHLQVGMPADICIVDRQKPWTVCEKTLLSAGKNTPFLGCTFNHKVTHTIINGEIVKGNSLT